MAHAGHLDGTKAWFYNFGQSSKRGAAKDATVVYLANRHYEGIEDTTFNEDWLQDQVVGYLQAVSTWDGRDLWDDYYWY